MLHKARTVHHHIEPLEPRQLLAAGDLDLTFGGGDGLAVAAFSGFSFTQDTGGAMAVQSDGKIVLAGRSGDGSNRFDRVAVARFNTDGILDNSFDGDGMATYTFRDTDVETLAIAPDGKIVVAGRTNFSTNEFSSDWFIMRLNPNGSPDASFGGGDGVVTRDVIQNRGEDIHGLAIQSDGKIVVTGVVSQSTLQLATARFEEDGDLDPTFSGDGIDIVDFFGGADHASDVIIDPDGKIVVVGGSIPVGTLQRRRFILLRYNPNGILDNTFDGDGKASTDFGFTAFATSVLRDPAGNYVVGGVAGDNGRQYAIARYTPAGVLDTSFGTNASMPGTTRFPDMDGTEFGFYGIARQSNGKIIFGGHSPSHSTPDDYMGLVRLLDNGAPDTTFGAGGVRKYDVPGYDIGESWGCDVAISNDGQILLAGHARGRDTDFAILNIISEDGLPPPPVMLNGRVLTVTGTPDNDVLALSADNTTFTAVFNDQTFTFPVATIVSLSINLGDGDDSETHITGVRGGNVNLGNGNDTLRVGTANKINTHLNVTGGLGDDAVTLDPAFLNSTHFDGGAGSDTFTYNSSQGNDSLLITLSAITEGSFFPNNYSNVERVSVFSNSGFDTLMVQGTNLGTTYAIDGGDGDEVLTFLNASNPDAFRGPLTFVGGPGTDELRFDDSPNARNDNYTITPTIFTRDSLATFSYQSTERLRVLGGGGANTFSVTPSESTSIFIDGNGPTAAPGDSINISLTDATGTDFLLLGAYLGRYTFTNRAAVEYQEVETDATPFGPTVKSSSFQYQTGQIIKVQFSEDTQDISLSDLVVKNLTTNATISPGIFVLQHNHGPGIATLAEWSVGLGYILADGNYEARLAAGSVRDTAGNLLAAEFVINFYVLSGDLNRDGVVSISDFIDLASHFNKTGAIFSEGDVNYDGSVTIADFIDLSSRFGQSFSGSINPIPMTAASKEPLVAPQEERVTNKPQKTGKRHHHRLIRKAKLPRRPGNSSLITITTPAQVVRRLFVLFR